MRIYMLLLPVLIALDGFSQKKELNVKVIDVKDDSFDVKKYAKNGDGFVFLRSKTKKVDKTKKTIYSIEKRNLEMNLVSSNDLPEKLDEAWVESIYFLADRYVLFYKKYENKELSINAMLIDSDNLEVANDKELFQTKNDLVTYGSRPNLVIVASENQKYFLIAKMHPYNKKTKGSQRISLKLIGDNLKTVWEISEYSLEMNENKSFINFDFVVSNDGKVFSVAYPEVERSDAPFEIYKFNKNGVYNNVLQFEDVIASGYKASLKFDKKGNLFLAGFTIAEKREESDYGGFSGNFLVLIDQSNLRIKNSVNSNYTAEELQEQLYQMSEVELAEIEALIAKYEKKAKKKRGYVEESKGSGYFINGLGIDYIDYDKDGNIYVIGARSIRGTYTDDKVGAHAFYGKEDVFISKFTKDFKHVYNLSIPFIKWGSETPCYTYLLREGGVSFVFLDNKKNKLDSPVVKTNRYLETENVLSSVFVSREGILEKKVLYDYASQGIEYFQFINDGALIEENKIYYLVATESYGKGVKMLVIK